MKLSEVICFLEEIAPPELADVSDEGRIGLILDRGNDINRIATALDVTDHVLKEAARVEAGLLVAHHTLIYEPVNRLTKSLSDTIKIALDNEISIYIMHTNYDRAPGGVNDILAGMLGLKNIAPAGMGRIGNITPEDTGSFARYVAERLDTHVQYLGDDEINTVMVLGGSGFRKEYIDVALEAGADALVSGELRHDMIRYARDISLIDATHYATENPAMFELSRRMPLDAVFIDHRPPVNVTLIHQ